MREKRGAGPGCTTSRSCTKVPRAARCGCSGASCSAEHRLDARVTAGEDVDPLGLCPRRERSGEPVAQRRPGRHIGLHVVSGLEPEPGEQLGVERRLEAPTAI